MAKVSKIRQLQGDLDSPLSLSFATFIQEIDQPLGEFHTSHLTLSNVFKNRRGIVCSNSCLMLKCDLEMLLIKPRKYVLVNKLVI